MSWSTSELRVRLAPLNRFKPSSKIFYWPFQGGTSFVDLLCFCSVLCLLCFVRVCLYVLCGHLLGKGWPLGSRLWCLLWVCHFPLVSWVRCGTWLYRFLIFAPLLTILDNYEGLIKCKVLPPKALFHPVLPCKVNGKLLFHLRKTCAETQQQTPCRHDNAERSFIGTWVTDEVKKA